MSQPLDRTCNLPQLGEVDEEAGEFWVENPFAMVRNGDNLSAYERNKVYLSVSGESFLDVSVASGADLDADSRAVIAADFTGDNAPDLLIGSVGGGSLRLFRNVYPQRNRVRIELVGVESNRSAIGTRIIAQCGERKIVRDLFAVNGFMGQGPGEMLLGIGDAEQIDQLTVRWPTGKTQVFVDVPAGSPVTIREGESTLSAQ